MMIERAYEISELVLLLRQAHNYGAAAREFGVSDFGDEV
jgi:hypothetical protein